MHEHDKWIAVAKDDLKMAKLALPQDLFSPLTFHCQQTAEKALKGYLVFKRQAIFKTHDLFMLLELCLKFDRDFEILLPAIRILNPYSTKFRYPSEYDIPDFADAELAVRQAQKILTFIIRKIAEPEKGQVDMFKVERG